jgi:chloramphenicol-sensitive protein RarD
MLWISLILAFSFAFYGLIRKLVAVPAVAGLTIETMVLAPLAAGFLLFAARDHSAAPIAADGVTKALLVASALVTTVPLLLFAEGARRLELSTLGFIQYLAPSLSFLCGILILGESLGPIQLGAFALIWLAIAIYVTDLLSHRRAGMTKSAPA